MFLFKMYTVKSSFSRKADDRYRQVFKYHRKKSRCRRGRRTKRTGYFVRANIFYNLLETFRILKICCCFVFHFPHLQNCLLISYLIHKSYCV